MNNSVTPYITILFLLMVPFFVSGQLSRPGTPPGFIHRSLERKITPEVLRQVETQRLLNEDLIFDTIKDIPWRFGENIDVHINPENSGEWNTLPNGDKIWRTEILSPGAFTLNLTFDKYRLPPGAGLYIYNNDRSMALGEFTDMNNQDDGYFATTLIKGDQITIEYFEPYNALFAGELNISTVTHAYRNPFDYLKSFGDGGSCNINVACEIANGWEDQINSVVLMISGGNAFCNGTVINNTNFDKTPYVLTSDHCYRITSTMVFWFNWQSETCTNPTTSPPYNSMAGATHVSRSDISDFWLLKLNQPIPDEFNVFYAGWSRNLAFSLTETISGIHHPRGDIKKFSYSETGVQTSTYFGSPGTGTTHWRITWSGGTTTERGSSGSAIFDSKKRIIGQLHGGAADCGNNLPDWYGRFGVSWTGGGTLTNRLSNWLDPLNTGLMTLNGFNPSIPMVENPTEFRASDIKTDRIKLSWDKNGNNNPVIIAANTEKVFSQPMGPYYLGQEMEFGGKIIYMGYDTTTTHTGLIEGKEYYYMIWSYDSTLNYSKGVPLSEQTACDYIVSFPYLESFNEEYIPYCWKQETVTGNKLWETGKGNNGDNPDNAFEGTGNALFRVTSEDEGSTTRLISPELDIAHYDNISLSFYYTNPDKGGKQDILRIYAKNANIDEWVLLQVFDLNITMWTKAELELPSFSNYTLIAFEATGNGGYGICVDKVEISGSWRAPTNLAVEIIDHNKPFLSWEFQPPSPDEKDGVTHSGFRIYRNDSKIFDGNDPDQNFYSDHDLPVGNYNYYATATYNDGNIESDPSNEILVTINPLGNEHLLTIINTGSGTTKPEAGQYYFKPESIIEIVAKPTSTHFLESWVINGTSIISSIDTLAFIINENTGVNAVFSLKKFELILQSDPTDAASEIIGSGNYEYGEEIEISAKPNIGFIFVQWTDGENIISTNPVTKVTITEDRILTAEFLIKDYNVTLEAQPLEAGSLTGGGIYQAGAEATIIAYPDDGWLFHQWLNTSNGNTQIVSKEPEYSFYVNNDISLIGEFVVFTPQLSIEKFGNGSVTPGPGLYHFEFDEEIPLSAIPDEGWRFVRWEINNDSITEENLIFRIRENSVVRAIFELKTHVHNVTPDNSLTIYPIPASEIIYIELPDAGIWDLEIISTQGQVSGRKRVSTAPQSAVILNIEQLTNGIYLIRANNGKELFYARFIVK